ncbi:hypothetical protein D3C76_1174300 [compost metagenome]
MGNGESFAQNILLDRALNRLLIQIGKISHRHTGNLELHRHIVNVAQTAEVPDKTLLIESKNLLCSAVRARFMQTDHAVTDLIEAFFGDRVINQRIITCILVDPDPRTLHNPHHADADQLFQCLSNGKT